MSKKNIAARRPLRGVQRFKSSTISENSRSTVQRQSAFGAGFNRSKRSIVVNHPCKTKESGFFEIQKPPRRYAVIDLQSLAS